MMKRLSYICILMLGVFSPYHLVMAQTQLEINKNACDELRKVDSELNQAYKTVLFEYKNDTVFLSKFIHAQRKWLIFRDAYLDSIYPNTQVNYYGSINSMCRCNILTHITTERLQQIKAWVNGSMEGDACAGSIKIH